MDPRLQELERRAEKTMARERHRPFPYSNDGLETATLIYDLLEFIKSNKEQG
jgi:hypothetical protein